MLHQCTEITSQVESQYQTVCVQSVCEFTIVYLPIPRVKARTKKLLTYHPPGGVQALT